MENKNKTEDGKALKKTNDKVKDMPFREILFLSPLEDLSYFSGKSKIKRLLRQFLPLTGIMVAALIAIIVWNGRATGSGQGKPIDYENAEQDHGAAGQEEAMPDETVRDELQETMKDDSENPLESWVSEYGLIMEDNAPVTDFFDSDEHSIESLKKGEVVYVFSTDTDQDGIEKYWIVTRNGKNLFIRRNLVKVPFEEKDLYSTSSDDNIFHSSSSVIIEENVLLRNAPAIEEDNIIGALTKGAEVYVLETETDEEGREWCLVQISNGNLGYVQNRFIGPVYCSGPLMITEDNAELRSNPVASEDNIIGRLKKGEAVEVFDWEMDAGGTVWYKIMLKDHTAAYVESKNVGAVYYSGPAVISSKIAEIYSKPVRKGESIIGTLKRGSGITVLSSLTDLNGTAWFRILLEDGRDAYVLRVDVSIAYTESDGSLSDSSWSGLDLINRDEVTIYSIPAMEGDAALRSLNTGDAVTAFFTETDPEGLQWCFIRLENGDTGYIQSEYIDVSSADIPERAYSLSFDYYNVTVRQASIYSAPDFEKGIIIGTLNDTYHAIVLDTETDEKGREWYVVLLKNGGIGYIYRSCLWYSVSGSEIENTEIAVNIANSASSHNVIRNTVLRSNPDTHAGDVVDVLMMGDTVTILGTQKDSEGIVWFEVRTEKGDTGFVKEYFHDFDFY